MLTNNGDDKKVMTMVMAYSALKAKKNASSKPYLMISELIDNSIGSWQEGGQVQDLYITIKIDNKNRVIICRDNAEGMDEDELLNSVQMYKDKTGNKMNMFGVGMKNAAFWFGEDLTIKTNNGSGAWTTSVKLSKINDMSEKVTWKIDADSSIKKSKGTEIIIENVYKERKPTPSEIKDIISVIETKYRLFMEENGDKTRVIIDFQIQPENGVEYIRALNSQIDNAQIIPPEKKKDFLNTFNKNFDREEKYLKGLVKQVNDKVNSGEPLKFNFDIPFIVGGIKTFVIKMEIGITQQGSKASDDHKQFRKHYGITAYQNRRAIRMSNVNPIEFKENLNAGASGSHDYTRSNIKRVFASCELGHIFKPDSNKSDFIFGEDRDLLGTVFKQIGDDILILADTVNATMANKQKVVGGLTPAVTKQLNDTINSRSNEWKWEIGANLTKASFYDKDKNLWEVQLLEASLDSDDESYFLTADMAGEHSIRIKYNVNHRIWKPLVSNSTQVNLKTTTYPLMAILGLAKIGIQNKLLKLWVPTADGDENDYSSAIDELAKFGLKI